MPKKIYKVESPPRHLSSNTFKQLRDPTIIAAIEKANSPYLHWKVLKYKDWIPCDKQAFWSILKTYRSVNSKQTIIKDKENNFFNMNIKPYEEFLHNIDKEMAGNFMGISDFTENDKRQFITRNIIEEAITSSQLEGANTTRAAAKKMLLEKRSPKDKSERMIFNTHLTMQSIEHSLKDEKLSLDLLLKLHRMITKDTLPENQQGVLRETFDAKGEPLVIEPWGDNRIVYEAPPREFVEEELQKLILFANDELPGEFIHPIIKAILLHFWIGLLHPFEDGNGRLARVLFYWYVLRQEYWAFAYLSLSEKILKSSKQYARAFIYSEQDENDLNYFIDYNINKLQLASKDFRTYIRKKVNENRFIATMIQENNGLNERQIKLIQYLNKGSQQYTTLRQYQTINSIGKVTASMDLKTLVNRELLKKLRKGRNIFYYPTENLKALF